MIQWAQDHATSIGAWWYAIVAALVFCEDALFVGFVIPGETAAVVGGAMSALGVLQYPIVLAIVIVAAILGDQVGYRIGHHLGPRLKASRPGRFVGAARWNAADEFFAKRGGPAVFAGRWVALMRALTPATAGMSRLPMRVFLPWNVLGGVCWSVVFVTLGYALGHSLDTLDHYLKFGDLALIVLVVLGIAFLVWRHRREGRRFRTEAVEPAE
jgi:membrane-associated protein